MLRTIALTGFAAMLAATAISLAPPARAQIGNIFSDPPLRPPGAIPRGNQPQPPPEDEEEVPELPRGRLLAPPPGTAVVPQNTQPGVAVQPPQPGGPAGPGVANAPPTPGLPPGQRQPKN